MWAARIASGDAEFAAQLGERDAGASAISARPIRSIGCSASSAMKASMMRSRGVPVGAAWSAVWRAK